MKSSLATVRRRKMPSSSQKDWRLNLQALRIDFESLAIASKRKTVREKERKQSYNVWEWCCSNNDTKRVINYLAHSKASRWRDGRFNLLLFMRHRKEGRISLMKTSAIPRDTGNVTYLMNAPSQKFNKMSNKFHSRRLFFYLSDQKR